jgi:hypothetical protein
MTVLNTAGSLATSMDSDLPKDHGNRRGLSELRLQARDVRKFHRTILWRSAATFTAMVLCHYQYLPLWILLPVNLVLYPEVYLRVHDIGHATSPRLMGLAARFIPVSNPIWGGTRVFAAIHAEHHKHLGTNKDPWLPYYVGYPLRALFFNFIEPEYSFREFVRRRGIDGELALNVLYHLACLAAGLFLFAWVYLAHVLTQRVVHMTGIFFFNFYTHRATLSASAPIGTWERERDLRPVLPLLRAIWGRDTIDGLIYHNRHHCLGQQHIPVHNYRHLVDSGVFTRFHETWPITQIKEL